MLLWDKNMCTICKKLKKGTLTVEEAREELDEQAEYLSEDHIEEIEEMLLIEEDSQNYIKSQILIDEEGEPLEEEYEEELEEYEDEEYSYEEDEE